MATLFLLRATTPEPILRERIARIGQDDFLLLIENGVYNGLKGNDASLLLNGFSLRQSLWVLEPDMVARGIRVDDLVTNVNTIDYAGFVELSIQADRIVTC